MSLDAQAEMPSDPGTALVLNSGRYLTSRAVTLLAMLMLLPTIAALLIWLFSSRISPRGAAHAPAQPAVVRPPAGARLPARVRARPLGSHPAVPLPGARRRPGPATNPKRGPDAHPHPARRRALRHLPALPRLPAAPRIPSGHRDDPPLRGFPQPALRPGPDAVPLAVPAAALPGRWPGPGRSPPASPSRSTRALSGGTAS